MMSGVIERILILMVCAGTAGPAWAQESSSEEAKPAAEAKSAAPADEAAEKAAAESEDAAEEAAAEGEKAAEESADKAEEAAAAAEEKAEAAADEAKAAGVIAPTDDAEATPAAPAEGGARPEATAGEEGGEESLEKKTGDDAAAALGAANPVVATNTGKPWQLMGSVGVSLGSSTFVNNTESQAAYNVGIIGLYRLAPLFQGRLDALARIAFDQVIDDGFDPALGAQTQNAFFFRDVRLGLLGRGLYREKITGLTFGANTTIDLPTSDGAQFWGRIFRWNVGVNVADMFQKVGPGNLLFTASLTFRKDVGEVNPTVDPISDDGFQIANCRSANATDQGACFTDTAPLNFAFIYGGSLRYFLGSFSIGAGVTFLNNFFHDLGDSDLSGSLAADPNRPASELVNPSVNAQDAPNHSLLMFTSASATYVFNRYFNMSLGVSQFNVPIRFQGDNPRALVSPLFDSPERNTTTVNLGAVVMY